MAIAYLGYKVDSSDVVQAEKRLDKMSGAAGAATRLVRGFAVAAAAAFSAGTIVRGIAQFETSMSRVAAVSRASASDLEAMRRVAVDLGTSTEFSASQAADGLNFLAMAGFSARESMAAIPDVLDLATASGMGLADTADIASNVISGFGLAANDAAMVADTLAAASSRANTDVSQLGRAMSTVAPISASLGISVQETAAAIGVLSDAGIQGERAGTAMRGVLASLAGPTTQAQAALAAYGVTLNQVNPETNNLADIMARLKEAGLSTADAMTIFGREAASGALALIEANSRVGELTQELKTADGAAGNMASTMRDNLGGDIKSLMSAAEGLILTLGEAGLTAVLRGVVVAVTAVTRGVTGAIKGLMDFFTFTDAMTQSAVAATIAMTDEANVALALTENLMGAGSMSRDVAGAKLALAEATLASAEAMRQESIEAVKATEKYQKAVADAEHARSVINTFNDLQRAGVNLTAEQAEDYGRFAAKIREAVAEQERLLASASAVSPEYERAQAHVALLREIMGEATGESVNFGSSVAHAAGISERLAAYLSVIPGYVDAGAKGSSVLSELLSGAARAAARLAGLLARAASYLPGLSRLGNIFRNMKVPGFLGDIGTQFRGIWEGFQRTINSPGFEVPDFGGMPSGISGGGGASGVSAAAKAEADALREVERYVDQTRTATEKYNAELEKLETLRPFFNQVGEVEAYSRAVEKVNTEYNKIKFGKLQKGIDSVSDAMAGAIVQGKNMGEALRNVFRQTAQELIASGLKQGISSLFGIGVKKSGGGLLGGLFSGFAGFFAKGGTLGAGQWGIAGENGPEPVVGPATIIPNNKMAASQGGNVSLTITVDGQGNIVPLVQSVSGNVAVQVVGAASSAQRQALPGNIQNMQSRGTT